MILLDPALHLSVRSTFSPAEQIARLLREATCRHCGQPPYSAAIGEAGPAGTDFEEIDDDERWLWELVDDADRVRAAAPPAPNEQQLAAARAAVTDAVTLHRRIAEQTALTWAALRRPSSWLRPRYRIGLARQLRLQHSAAATASTQLDRVRRHLATLERQTSQRAGYLAARKDSMAAGANARIELDRRIDEMIDGYAQLASPPAWFRFGLGYPPRPDDYAAWLVRAREAIGERRRRRPDAEGLR